MKIVLLLVLVTLALSVETSLKSCFDKAKTFEANVVKSLQNGDLDIIIDQLETLFEEVPDLMVSCGDKGQAEQIKTEYPPVCTKVLAKEAKLLVKIMRLYTEDKQKNQKSILLYTTLFETIYKTQVQKKCPFLAEQHLSTIQNKGDCAEGTYRLSLVFETLDGDLLKGDFNKSLTDMGKVIKQLPDTLDSCSQHTFAKIIRNSFPDQCLKAIGILVREAAKIQHNYTHFQWLKAHLKDFTQALNRVRSACPALEHK